MVDTATSPHIQWVDYKVIPISEYPDSPSCNSTDSQSTIWDQDAPEEEYYMSNYKADSTSEEATCSYSHALEKKILPAKHGTEGEYVVDMGVFSKIMCARL